MSKTCMKFVILSQRILQEKINLLRCEDLQMQLPTFKIKLNSRKKYIKMFYKFKKWINLIIIPIIFYFQYWSVAHDEWILQLLFFIVFHSSNVFYKRIIILSKMYEDDHVHFYTTIVFSSHLSNIIILVIFFLLFLDITFSFGETNYLTTILRITSYLTLCGLAFFLALFSEVLLNSFKKETGAWISYISHAFLTLSLYLMCIYPDKWYNICVCYIPLHHHHHHFVDHHHQLRRHLALTTHYIHFFIKSWLHAPCRFHHFIIIFTITKLGNIEAWLVSHFSCLPWPWPGEN